MKDVRMRSGAQAGREDALRPQPRPLQLLAVGAPQIEIGPSRRAGLEPPLDAPLVVPGRPEHLDDLGAHLATTRAEARSDRGDQVLWAAPEFPRQRRYRHAGNP